MSAADGNLNLAPSSPGFGSAGWALSITTALGYTLMLHGPNRGAYQMQNPGFESDTSGWSTSGGSPGVTLTRVAGGHTGTGAAALTNIGTGSVSCVLNDAPTS
jgi:hypothetical protein